MGTEEKIVLRDLGDIVKQTREKLQEFKYDDVELNDSFKQSFSSCIKNSGNTLNFKRTIAVISNSSGQKIYAPNQWFVLAAYAVPLTKEVMQYRVYTEKYIEKNIELLKSISSGKIKEKKDVYQLLRSGDDAEPIKSMVAGELKKLFVNDFLEDGYNDATANQNSEYLIKFMTDAKWWLGGKGIERANDYYVSPALGVLNLVNASQSYVATMTYLYINDKNLYKELDSIVVECDAVKSEERIEETNKRLFRYWLELQVKPEGDSDAGNPYSKNSIDAYVSNVGNTKLANEPDKSVYFTTDVGEVKATIEVLDKEDKKNNTQRSAVRKYLEYIMNLDQESEDYDEILKHNLWGIHMKEKNTALSDENPHICIGWSAMGDLSELKTVDEISVVYDQYFADRNNRARGQEVGMIRRFLKDLQIGDYVIFAETSEFHIGRIESDYYFDSTDYEGQSTDYKNTRKVKWLKKHISRKDISKAMHNSLATAMSIFGINDYRAAVVDLLRGTYRKDDDIIDSPVEPVNLVFQTTVELPYDNNRIVFGAPGTGKSYQLKKDSENVIKTHDAELERVTFHPDYSYSQFVGTYKPVMDEDGEKIKYQYVPGPFMRVLVKALKSAMTSNPKPYILIIEEINRAKVAAVFGEVFQLLDRDEDGISEYDIQASEDIRRYLSEELGGNPTDFDRIRIPNNMYIWATMNSADQGVFPMDTAFKRRWNFEYLGINESEKYIQGVGKIMLPSSDEPVEWNILRKAINDKMSSSDFKINEDKLMGPFFLSQKMFISDEDGMIINPKRFVSAFKSKVIMYLYEDAVKQGKHRFFEGCNASKYSSVCEAFDEIGMGIFGATFKENYYDKQRNDA